MSTKRKTIIIIDDEPRVLKALQRLLGLSDFITEVFNSAETFLQRSDTSDVACIVLDINMGGMSGIEMRRRLKATDSKIPVIFMTALDTAAVRSAAMDAGCAAFFQKPFSGQALIDSIKNATSLV